MMGLSHQSDLLAMQQKWGKIVDAAAYSGVSVRTFRKWFKAGLQYSRLSSGTIMVRFDEIDRFLENHIEGHLVKNDLAQVVDEIILGIYSTKD